MTSTLLPLLALTAGSLAAAIPLWYWAGKDTR